MIFEEKRIELKKKISEKYHVFGMRGVRGCNIFAAVSE